MTVLSSVKDHILIGGPNAMAGWGLLTLVVFIGGFLGGRIIVSNVPLWLLLVVTAFLTGSGSYAINAVNDIETDKVNKPYRPLPSGRMTREHALKYSYALLA